jgi:hypothetical protein
MIMPNQWTPERRAAQSERIKALKPWLKSTGPQSITGKKKSSRNALKHGRHSAEHKRARKAMKLHREFMRQIVVVLRDAENKLL